MRRHQGKMRGEKFVGDANINEVHDLDNEKSLCRIEEILFTGQDVPFSSLAMANAGGFKNCPYCIGKSLDASLRINGKLFGNVNGEAAK
jgi:hypothetical protein